MTTSASAFVALSVVSREFASRAFARRFVSTADVDQPRRVCAQPGDPAERPGHHGRRRRHVRRGRDRSWRRRSTPSRRTLIRRHRRRGAAGAQSPAPRAKCPAIARASCRTGRSTTGPAPSSRSSCETSESAAATRRRVAHDPAGGAGQPRRRWSSVSQLVARRVTAPIDGLVRFSQDVGGGTSRRAQVGDDDVGRLGRAFNEMLDRLEQSQAALVRSEKLGARRPDRRARRARHPQPAVVDQDADAAAASAAVAAIARTRDARRRDAARHQPGRVGHPRSDRAGPAGRAAARPADLNAVDPRRRSTSWRRSSRIARSTCSSILAGPAAARRRSIAERFQAGAAQRARQRRRRDADGRHADRRAPGPTAPTSSSRCATMASASTRGLLDRVFDPFVSTKRDGVGLGLVNAKAVVEGHGGQHRADASPATRHACENRPTRQSSIDSWLTFSSSTTTSRSPPPSSGSSTTRDTTAVLGKRRRGRGAPDRRARPDLVMMDIRMPGIDGLPALQTRCSRCHPDLYVVMMTALRHQPDVDRRDPAGAFEYLTKPLDLDGCARVIARALASGTAGRHRTRTATRRRGRPRRRHAGDARGLQDDRAAGDERRAGAHRRRARHRQGARVATIHDNSAPPRRSRSSRVDCTPAGGGARGGTVRRRDRHGASGGRRTRCRARCRRGSCARSAIADRARFDRTRCARASSRRPIGRSVAAVAAGTFSRELYDIVLAHHDPPAAAARASRGHSAAGPPLHPALQRRAEPQHQRRGRPGREQLQEHAWPGNVGELESVLKRASILARGDVITAERHRASCTDSVFRPARRRTRASRARCATALQERLVGRAEATCVGLPRHRRPRRDDARQGGAGHHQRQPGEGVGAARRQPRDAAEEGVDRNSAVPDPSGRRDGDEDHDRRHQAAGLARRRARRTHRPRRSAPCRSPTRSGTCVRRIRERPATMLIVSITTGSARVTAIAAAPWVTSASFKRRRSVSSPMNRVDSAGAVPARQLEAEPLAADRSGKRQQRAPPDAERGAAQDHHQAGRNGNEDVGGEQADDDGRGRGAGVGHPRSGPRLEADAEDVLDEQLRTDDHSGDDRNQCDRASHLLFSLAPLGCYCRIASIAIIVNAVTSTLLSCISAGFLSFTQ